MPKSKLADIISHKDDRDYISNVAWNISYEMAVRKISIKDIAEKSGIKESTIRLRLSDPGTLRQREIVEIAKVLKVSPFRLAGQKLKYIEGE